MDIAQFISQFIYRIRYLLLWGTLFVTGLVIYFTQFLPYSYTVESSIYAGVTNSTTVDGTTVNYTVIYDRSFSYYNIAHYNRVLDVCSSAYY